MSWSPLSGASIAMVNSRRGCSRRWPDDHPRPGNIKLVAGEWNEAFIDELANFPSGHQKDQVDALSGAFARLVQEGQLILRADLGYPV
jgi:hypothetical protein